MYSTVAIIPKEEIGNCTFVNHEVLADPAARKERNSALMQAMLLGNGYKGKVRIYFETTEGIKAVETTVWQASDKNISLKGGTIIPVHAIHEVRWI